MKSIKFTALFLGAVLFLGLGATSISAKSEDVKKVERKLISDEKKIVKKSGFSKKGKK